MFIKRWYAVANLSSERYARFADGTQMTDDYEEAIRLATKLSNAWVPCEIRLVKTERV